ncbi:MAG: type I-B CRISPR-associated protein Cas7/Csh2 [Clostridiales bacterium]|nr:type I-B CRISPR-associated protein Cas7/Csh2 [Clostridiales bacterium]
MAKSREFLLVWDSTMANPNGDMLNENRPRQDEETGKLEVSDVRIKRFIREEWINTGKKVLVQSTTDEKGKVLSCASTIKLVASKEDVKDEDLVEFLLKNFIDVRLFGAVVTKPKKDIMGPLQITWSKSIHEAEVKFMQGNAAYASKDGAEQSSIWGKHISPYALFKTYAVFNNQTALKQDIAVSEEDIQLFVTALIDGMKNYRSTSKNQMPRLLVEVVYKNNALDGELNFIQFKKEVSDIELREINEVEIDLSKLGTYYDMKKDDIEKVIIYRSLSANVINIHENFEIKDI